MHIRHIEHLTANQQAQLADILRDVVNNGGASVSFVIPVSEEEALNYWAKVANDIESGSTILLGAFTDDDHLVGTVQLVLAWQPNAPHRAEVAKMLVHGDYQRQGIATQLMIAAEEHALAANRWLLTLDTERDNHSEKLYSKLGYTRVGAIAQFALNGAGDTFIDTIYYYKILPH